MGKGDSIQEGGSEREDSQGGDLDDGDQISVEESLGQTGSKMNIKLPLTIETFVIPPNQAAPALQTDVERTRPLRVRSL